MVQSNNTHNKYLDLTFLSGPDIIFGTVLCQLYHKLILSNIIHLLLMPSISVVFLTAKNNFIAKEEQISFKDCAEAFKSGLTTSGIYTLTVSNTAQEKKVG